MSVPKAFFTNQNSENAAVGDQPAYLNDTLSIFTLLNDAIIMTQASTGSALDLTADPLVLGIVRPVNKWSIGSIPSLKVPHSLLIRNQRCR